jgi:hypothetical protein
MSYCWERNFGNVFTDLLPSNGHMRQNIKSLSSRYVCVLQLWYSWSLSTCLYFIVVAGKPASRRGTLYLSICLWVYLMKLSVPHNAYHKALTGKMVNEQWSGRMLWPNLWYYPSIFLERLMEIMKVLCQDCRFQGWGRNRGRAECEWGLLPTRPRHSVL